MAGHRRVIVLVCALVVALSASAPAFALTRTRADAVARSVFGAQPAGDVAVLGLPAALPAGAAVSEAGPGPGERWTVVPGSGGSKLTVSVPRTVLTRPGWLFWEDTQSGANFPHSSRLLLVDDRTGHVTWQKTIDWWPLVNDKPAAFYTRSNRAAYRATAAAGVSAAIPGFKHDCAIELVDLSDGRPLANFAGDGQELDHLFSSFGMQSQIVGSVQDLASVSNRMIDEGCKDVVVFVGGHGTPAEGPGATAEPTVVLHTKVMPTGDGQQSVVADDVVTAGELATFVTQRHGKATFKFLINSCYSGRFVDELKKTPGVVFVATASAADEPSYQSLEGDTAADHPHESGNWIAALGPELEKILDGKEPNVDPVDVTRAKGDLVFALTLAADLAPFTESGADKAAASGLTHPEVTGALANALDSGMTWAAPGQMPAADAADAAEARDAATIIRFEIVREAGALKALQDGEGKSADLDLEISESELQKAESFGPVADDVERAAGLDDQARHGIAAHQFKGAMNRLDQAVELKEKALAVAEADVASHSISPAGAKPGVCRLFAPDLGFKFKSMDDTIAVSGCDRVRFALMDDTKSITGTWGEKTASGYAAGSCGRDGDLLECTMPAHASDAVVVLNHELKADTLVKILLKVLGGPTQTVNYKLGSAPASSPPTPTTPTTPSTPTKTTTTTPSAGKVVKLEVVITCHGAVSAPIAVTNPTSAKPLIYVAHFKPYGYCGGNSQYLRDAATGKRVEDGAVIFPPNTTVYADQYDCSQHPELDGCQGQGPESQLFVFGLTVTNSKP
jgi:hypothetical protein